MSAESTPARTWNDGTTRRRGANRASIIAADENSLSHKLGTGSGQVAVRPAVRLGFTYVRRRTVGFKSRRGGFARSNTQLFDNAFEDRLFLTQGLQPLVLLGFDDFLSQFGDVDFKRAPHGVALRLTERYQNFDSRINVISLNMR
jgi:hypothetical protein